jgi:peptide/nickel transport system permease protein
LAQAAPEVVGFEGGPGEPEARIKGRSPWQLFWARFKEDKLAFVGLFFIALLVILALAAPLISKYVAHRGPNDLTLADRMLDDFGLPTGPNETFLFGADESGRDLFVRVIYGARTSLQVAVLATGLSVVLGVILGIIAGYYGGKIDTIISRSIDIILSMPLLLFAIGVVAACSTQQEGCYGTPVLAVPVGALAGILVASYLSTSFSRPVTGTVGVLVGLGVSWALIQWLDIRIKPGLPIIIVVIGFFSWPYIARIVRGNTLSVREKEFIEASRSLGASNRRIMFREVLPNLTAPIIVYTTLIVPQNILFEAALSFLGLGVPQSIPSWGRMLSEASDVYEVAWWMMFFPGLFLFLTTLAFNLVGDGLRDALDPRTGR